MNGAQRMFTLAIFLLCLLAPRLQGDDKNGVSPQAVSLPSGPGSIQGLGESYQPQLNTGAGTYSLKIDLPTGTGGTVPELSLGYNTGSPNGALGIGWSLSGLSMICRNTDEGVPLYVDGPNGVDDDRNGVVDNPEEIDAISGIDYEEVVRLADGSFRSESEGSFVRYERLGDGWVARAKNGTRFLYGLTPQARVEDSGRVFQWCLERFEDRNGNAIDYEYMADPNGSAQTYPRRIRWGQPDAYFAVVFTYEAGRPDVFTSYRSGFEITTSRRLARIDVISHGVPPHATALRRDFDGDGRADALIRRYELAYDAEAPVSLLTRVEQVGADGGDGPSGAHPRLHALVAPGQR